MVWDEDIGENMPLPSPGPQQDVPNVPGDEPLDIGAQEVGDEFVPSCPRSPSYSKECQSKQPQVTIEEVKDENVLK